MGEYADMIINGEICEECMLPLTKEYGYPVSCKECGGSAKIDRN